MSASDPGAVGRVAGLVSVVVPVHERPRLVVEAVDSALTQTYPDVEVIVVDDASRDETPAAIAALVARGAGRVRAIRHEVNRGPGASRESGRRAARGEYLQFLDSDDLLLPTKLGDQIAALAASPAAGVAYGWTRRRELDGRLQRAPVRRTGERLEELFPALLEGRIWITTTPLYRAEVCEAAGGWSALRLDEDWEFESRLGALRTRLAFVDRHVAEHRAHPGEHAGTADRRDPAKLADRARALAAILANARRAGVGNESAEMARFARALFSMARRCGAAGLTREAGELFVAARAASTAEAAAGWDFRLVGWLAAIAGWRAAGRWTERLDRRRLGGERGLARRPG